jgi:hypothetical protein
MPATLDLRRIQFVGGLGAHELRRSSARSMEFAADPRKKEIVMEDLVYLALSVAFFAATVGMAYLFERLREHK